MNHFISISLGRSSAASETQGQVYGRKFDSDNINGYASKNKTPPKLFPERDFLIGAGFYFTKLYNYGFAQAAGDKQTGDFPCSRVATEAIAPKCASHPEPCRRANEWRRAGCASLNRGDLLQAVAATAERVTRQVRTPREPCEKWPWPRGFPHRSGSRERRRPAGGAAVPRHWRI